MANKGELAPGLYLVATPIGNARDITLRALDLLASADLLAAEDTRSLRRLMEIHGIAPAGRRVIAYHDHNGARMRPQILQALAEGQSVVYASEAGTPMISDPGFDLARAVTEAGFPVTSAPGPSAVVAALTLAGLPTDRFHFAGFLPNAQGARRKALEGLRELDATLVLYESPRRVAALLTDASEILGPRPAALCRELTKKFEETRRMALPELAASCESDPPKGEIVVLIGKSDSEKIKESDVEQAVKTALDRMSVRDAADFVSVQLGVKRRPVYQLAMRLAAERDSDGKE
ncbi:16S rRNA methyltransferase [Pseudoponticoccus marisrubri]|uniref:Ribosomal RNA small subunit methyltransferase I n=1 Tax=Pseudoponticoccus marisrubri TaxID=1685382 RepID=A0A0W7WQH9_9RHOB|nr:16S rRNA methyltransferase [Pseudoponticoccus marisrubri]